MTIPDLPIHDALPALIVALHSNGVAVLQAPPGAGKTTVVPLAIMDAGLSRGKIIMLEPRRLAARAAAERMASTLGETVGQSVGYRIRGDTKVSSVTKIEVVTEGILTRMLQSDPALPGYGTVIFDEFHERSLHGDLGLALIWDIRSVLREDLKIVVMSATLDAEPVAEMLDDAPVITSEGRAFPVTIQWLEKPPPKNRRFELSAADLILQALSETDGSVLVFLPGEGEIRRVQQYLRGKLNPDCVVYPLFGAMDLGAQRAAIAPITRGRKIVLATAIAETSLTIEGIRVVVDCGQARRARFDPGSGMSQLVTERVTKAEAEQRRGRAGRITAGTCYRMWTKGEHGGLASFAPPEIVSADLTPFALELALWGATRPTELALLTAPNPGAIAQAQDLLQRLGALDTNLRITDHGRRLARIPLHPRLAHMLLLGGQKSTEFAALLAMRDPFRFPTADLDLRRRALAANPAHTGNDTDHRAKDACKAIRSEAKRLRKFAAQTGRSLGWAELAALAYPDRVGLRRPGNDPKWVLAGGKGAALDPQDPLASARLIVATDLAGDNQESRIRSAIQISESELRALYPSELHWHEVCEWDRRERRVVTREQERFGALVLADRAWTAAPPDVIAHAVLDGIRDIGLTLSPAARRLQARVELVRRDSDTFPDFSDSGLRASLDDWLKPFIKNVRSENDIKKLDVFGPLQQRLTWDQKQTLDTLAPPEFTTPMNRRVAIDYAGEMPEITVKLQEMFGVVTHPTVGPADLPIRIVLMSPGKRAVQTTTDLPRFWATSYADVRKDMRGRYPKHPWPEDPTQAAPTLRAKPRKH